jgi:predicted XRE-type DNA-binding protein
MSVDPSESVWFHLYDDREKAAELELRSTLVFELQQMLDTEKSSHSADTQSRVTAIAHSGKAGVSALALLVHDLGYRIEIKLVPRRACQSTKTGDNCVL